QQQEKELKAMQLEFDKWKTQYLGSVSIAVAEIGAKTAQGGSLQDAEAHANGAVAGWTGGDVNGN
ncbi:MAG TPA: hypothetical protein VIF60_24405, partial [Burkholderiaceae bacterium]